MEYIWDYNNLYEAFRSAEKCKRYRKEVLAFKQNLEQNLFDIQRDLMNGTYKTGPYREFYIRYPKPRLVMALGFRDRVVQWAIYRQMNPYLEKRFIGDSYACRKGKGSTAAVERVQSWQKQIIRKPDGKNWYCLKIDIAKYFYRVDHGIALNLLRKVTDDERFIHLMDNIINNTDVPFGLPIGVSADDCPPEERLYDVGMPIGNLSSQMIANLYLNELDQYCKRVLHIRRYARYMDDIVILDNDLKRIHQNRDRIAAFVEEHLALQLNRKTSIRKMTAGVEFVGRIITPRGVRLRKTSRFRIKRVFKREMRLYSMGFADIFHVKQLIASYYGQMMYMNTYNLRKWIFENIAFIRMNQLPRGVLATGALS